jgi:hypothetical protein
MQVVSHLNNNKEHDSTELIWCHIIGKCPSLISSFENCKVSYFKRQTNRVVHELARTTRFNASRQVFDYCPSCIQLTLMNEMH